MLKLPPLQPHLTGSNGIESKDWKQRSTDSAGAEFRQSRSFSQRMRVLGHEGVPGVMVRVWGEQAQSVTQALEKASYRSLATEVEIRLREALEKCDVICGAHLEQEPRPRKIRTAACCQIFQELASMAGPFSSVLKILCHELVASVYSDFYASDSGTSVMDQLPYYVVVDKLEAEKAALAKEQTQFREELAQQQNQLWQVNEQVKALAAGLRQSEAEKEKLVTEAAKLRKAEEDALYYAEIAKNELKNMRRELVSTKDSLGHLRVKFKQQGNEMLEMRADMEASSAALQKQLAESETACRGLKAEMRGMVSKDDLKGMTQELETLRVETASQKLEISSQDAELQDLRQRTPRPDWRSMDVVPLLAAGPHGMPLTVVARPGKPAMASRDVVKAAAERMACYRDGLSAAEDEVSLLRDLLAPEPVTLSVDLETMRVTSSSDTGTSALTEEQRGKPLGSAASVPRMLRWRTPVTIAILSPSALEETLFAILLSLPRRASSSLHEALYYRWLQDLRDPKAVASAGYSLVLSLQRHRNASATAALIFDALHGAAPYSALRRAGELARSMRMLITEAAAVKLPDAPATGLIPRDDVLQLLRRLFPGKAESDLMTLAAALGTSDDAHVHMGDVIPQAMDHIHDKYTKSSPAAAVDKLGDRADDAHAADDEAAETGQADTTSFEDGPDASDGVRAPPVNVVQEAVRQHCAKVLHLRSAARAAVEKLEDDHVGRDVPAADVVDALRGVEGLDQSLLAAACWFDDTAGVVGPMQPNESMSIDDLARRVLQRAPLQAAGDFDLVAARQWLQGLQGKAEGVTSAAGLPEVA